MDISVSLRNEVPILLTAFAASVLAGPRVITALRALKFGQNINTDAPALHLQKQGTPSMGGALLVLGVTVALIVGSTGHAVSAPLIAVYLVFIAHAGLGFADDYLSIRRGKSLGLKARQKLAGQLAIGLAFVVWLALTAQPGYTTVLTLGRATVDLGVAYYPLVLLLIVGLSNATNLTDGLDGLAGGLATLSALGLAWTVFTAHAGLERLPEFGYAVAGACLGFLWFNAHPARVFMGDTGSLALGSGFAAMAVVGKQEVLLLVFALVFLAELVSVMVQVSVFQLTGGKAGGGRRVFKMSPLHHHFELSGWPETQVVARFWIVGALALAAGLWLASPLAVSR